MNAKTGAGLLTGALALAVAGWFVIRPIYQYTTEECQKVQVVSAWIKQEKYLASLKYGSGKVDTASVEDSWYWLTFNASNRFGELKAAEGKEIWIKQAGMRIGLLSWFPNVVRVNCNK
jgi:glucan-binding YG repeat protein